jgi:hypothetical protein
MIYLTFDSNIWIYLLDESWREDNALDYLEHWISEKHVKILLPNLILTEWDNHKEKEKEERKKTLRDFFSMAEEILPSSFFDDYKRPDKQSEIIESQFNRIENLLRTDAELIDISSEVKNKAIERSIKKDAPMHKNKNSVADTLIILSLLEFAKENQQDEYIFLSENIDDFFEIENKKNNKPKEIIELWESFKKEMIDHDKLDSALIDFFEKSYKIHTDLKDDFSQFKLMEFRKLKSLIEYLKSRLPITVNLDNIRRERIKNRIKEITYNPEYEKLVKDLPNSNYIENINHLDIILKKNIPTKEEAKFTFSLIDSESSYKEYFFNKVKSSAWFKILKEKGVFNPENNPAPIQVKEGFQIPFWKPLTYLEKLSMQIKNGQELEFIDEIIAIINRVSETPTDNYRTWHLFIKILTNLPKDKIPIATLKFIPTWLKGNFDTIIQSAELCDNLLPKFLLENPTTSDIAKAELILQHLLSIEKKEVVHDAAIRNENESYHSRVYMYYLSDSLIDKRLTERIAAKCSTIIVTNLANNIKKLRFDFPKGINILFIVKEKEYSIKTEIENENLKISISEKDNPEKIIGTRQLLNFENLNEQQTKDFFIAILKEFEIEYQEEKDNEISFGILNNALTNGLSYTFSDEPISNLNNEYNDRNKVVEVFSLVFRDLLNYTIKQNVEEGIKLLQSFAFDNKYRLPFFRRVVLFVIGDNWEAAKTIFWAMISDNDPSHYFSSYSFNKDLYELLNKNQLNFSKEEIKALQKIITIGPQEDRDSKYIDYWQLRWYSALRNISPFRENYDKLSQSENLTNEHYEKDGIITTRFGSVSPFNVEEILKKSNEEIVKFIHSFNPKDRWEEPTIDGLSGSLGKAVEEEPQKFSDEIELYEDVYYIYAYHIANGFREAWKNKRPFNWEKVLIFYKEYITSEKFISGQLNLQNDGWRATSDWVAGSVGNLLAEGMQSDSNAFDLSFLPIAKDILKILVPKLKAVEDFKQMGMDYPTYSLNSNAGKIIRTLLDYSLRRARTLNPKDNLPKWEDDVIYLFEETFKRGIIDSYILTGWYFQQFYFLNKDWIINKVKGYYKLDDKQWLAFISGFIFGNPPFNKDIYQLFYPHYKRAIINNAQIKKNHDHGIIRHIVAFYFWGFEDLKTQGLLTMMLNTSSPLTVLELVNFVWRHEDYLRGLKQKEVNKFENIIFNLWNFLANKYQNPKNDAERLALAGLLNLLVFVPELNEKYTELVLKSCGIANQHNHINKLIKNLIRLKGQGKLNETAKYVGVILNKIEFSLYVSGDEQKQLIDLVVYLYQNGQTEIAVEFCNRLTKQGHEFLIQTHNKYRE